MVSSSEYCSVSPTVSIIFDNSSRKTAIALGKDGISLDEVK